MKEGILNFIVTTAFIKPIDAAAKRPINIDAT